MTRLATPFIVLFVAAFVAAQDETSSPAVVTETLPGATALAPYVCALKASGGKPPYIWSAEGSLPVGIALDENGVLGGTPRESGRFAFTVVVTDAAKRSARKVLLLNVAPAPAPQRKPKVDPSTVEGALALALDWLARHQDTSALGGEPGRWEAAGFMRRCVGEQCSNPLSTSQFFDVGVSSLALMAFVSAGETHRVGRHKAVVGAALKWLLSKQDAMGWIGRPQRHGLWWTERWYYNHVLASWALCEALAASGDADLLRSPCEKAISRVLVAQNPQAGWRYEPGRGASDTSLTSLSILALDAARRARIDLPWRRLKATAGGWLKKMCDAETGRFGYLKAGDGGYAEPGVNDEYLRAPATTALAVRALQVLGETLPGRSLRLLATNPPVWGESGRGVDMYYWWHATCVLSVLGGEGWTRWRAAVAPLLIKRLCGEKDGCARGSFPPVGKWALIGGRVYSTALAAVVLGRCARAPAPDKDASENGPVEPRRKPPRSGP